MEKNNNKLIKFTWFFVIYWQSGGDFDGYKTWLFRSIINTQNFPLFYRSKLFFKILNHFNKYKVHDFLVMKTKTAFFRFHVQYHDINWSLLRILLWKETVRSRRKEFVFVFCINEKNDIGFEIQVSYKKMKPPI